MESWSKDGTNICDFDACKQRALGHNFKDYRFIMKIQNKLFLFLFLFSLSLVTMLVLLMQWSIGKGMVEYVHTKEIETLKPVVLQLKKEYEIDNSWQSMFGEHNKFRHLISEQFRGTDFEFQPKGHLPERPFGRDHRPPNKASNNTENKHVSHHPKDRVRPPPLSKNEAHYALLDTNETLIVGRYIEKLEYTKTHIIINNQTVGFFLISKRNRLTQGYEFDFIEQQQHYLWLIALLTMTLVALVTFPLARHIVEPIKEITRGMHKLTHGDYQHSIDLKRQDELGELNRDYNELALTLTDNESTRKRWLANISHELRTPVAILRGELEAMLDNVRPITPKNIMSAHDEVKHLQRLIDDLNFLTSTEVGGMRYHKQHVNLLELMQGDTEKYSSYLADSGISLNVEFNSQAIFVYGDQTRLSQLFENIITNCIKYSSATALNISLTVGCLNKKNQEVIALLFEDNGKGVEDVHLEHLFEHLYRVDHSRNRKTGGTGLGLSICRHIVIAHQGVIIAKKSSIGGLAISIELPLG
jgi:two-component system sensor histidine kinase BaeS